MHYITCTRYFKQTFPLRIKKQKLADRGKSKALTLEITTTWNMGMKIAIAKSATPICLVVNPNPSKEKKIMYLLSEAFFMRFA